MSLVGKYFCAELSSYFVVQYANDVNGVAGGYFELDNITIPVNIHYHFQNNVGPVTNLWLSGNLDNPNEYVGGAGRTLNTGYNEIDIAGGYPTDTGVQTFEGKYIRQ